MIVIGKKTNMETQDNKKDSQQDTRIDSLQTAVDSLNAQVSAINASITAINASIEDKYSAQTQTLMSALTSQINALSDSLSSVVSTARVSADIGNFERMAVTLVATISNVTADILKVTNKAEIESADVENLNADNGTVTSLNAQLAMIQEATVTLLHIADFTAQTIISDSVTSETVTADSVFSDNVESEEINARNISGKEWQTPISTPDNTELLEIAIPKYNGVIQLQTMDDKLSLTLFNNGAAAYNEKADYIYRVERDENNINVYLANIGDTINYRLLYIGSEDYAESHSEIVDKTNYQKNIEDFAGLLFFDDSGGVSTAGDYQKKITGAASTITENNLAKNLVMVTDDDGKAGVENVTRDELRALQGVTGNIQEQLDEKQDKALSVDVTLGGHTYGTVESALAAVVSVLNALITDDIIYIEAEEELIFPYNSISYDNEELTVTGFNVSVVGEEITFTR